MDQSRVTLLARTFTSGLIACVALACSDGSSEPVAGAGGMASASAMAGSGAMSGAGASGAAGGGAGGMSGNGGTGGAAGVSGVGGQGGGAGTMDDGGVLDGSMNDPDAAMELPTTWTTGEAMPTIRTELAVAELDGLVYVAGGYDGLTAFEVYDPANDSWDTLADLPLGSSTLRSRCCPGSST